MYWEKKKSKFPSWKQYIKRMKNHEINSELTLGNKWNWMKEQDHWDSEQNTWKINIYLIISRKGGKKSFLFPHTRTDWKEFNLTRDCREAKSASRPADCNWMRSKKHQVKWIIEVGFETPNDISDVLIQADRTYLCKIDSYLQCDLERIH